MLHLIHGRDSAGDEAPILQGLRGRVRECIAMPAGLLVIVHGPSCRAPASLGPLPHLCVCGPPLGPCRHQSGKAQLLVATLCADAGVPASHACLTSFLSKCQAGTGHRMYTALCSA